MIPHSRAVVKSAVHLVLSSDQDIFKAKEIPSYFPLWILSLLGFSNAIAPFFAGAKPPSAKYSP